MSDVPAQPATPPAPTPTPTPAPAPAPAAEPAQPAANPTLAEAFAATQGNPLPVSQPQPAQPDPGQAPVAPDVGQGGKEAGKPVDPNAVAPVEGQAATEPTPDEILAQLGTKETPDAKMARMEREGGASRKESLRWKKVAEAHVRILKEQALVPVVDEEGVPKHLAPGEGYGKGDDFSVKFSDLTEEQQTRYEADPQALIDHTINRAKQALIRATPTVEKAVQPVSQERELAAVEFLSNVTFDDGETKKHPNLAKNAATIKQYLAAPGNEALREFRNQNPELAIGMIDSYIETIKTLFFANAKQNADEATKLKASEAAKDFVPGPQGGGEAAIVDPNASPEDQGKAWAKRFGGARSY